MTKKKWIDRFVKQFIRGTDSSFKALAKDAAQVSYLEYGNPESRNYDKDYSPENAADDEYFAMCSDA